MPTPYPPNCAIYIRLDPSTYSIISILKKLAG